MVRAMRRRGFFQHLLLVGGALALAACRHRVAPPPPGPDSLPNLITARLLLAREVAAAKLYSGAPVHDPAREAAILEDLVAQGRARGLDPVEVQTFFSAQIAASRRVQEELIAAWRAGEARPDHPPLDLRTELRPRLDALTPHFLEALSAARAATLAPDTAHALSAAGFSPAVIALATAPLR
jgi:chorismate mutase